MEQLHFKKTKDKLNLEFIKLAESFYNDFFVLSDINDIYNLHKKVLDFLLEHFGNNPEYFESEKDYNSFLDAIYIISYKNKEMLNFKKKEIQQKIDDKKPNKMYLAINTPFNGTYIITDIPNKEKYKEAYQWFTSRNPEPWFEKQKDKTLTYLQFIQSI